jgi:hypothetical protein
MFTFLIMVSGTASVLWTLLWTITLVGETATDAITDIKKHIEHGGILLLAHAIIILFIVNHQVILAQIVYGAIAVDLLRDALKKKKGANA